MVDGQNKPPLKFGSRPTEPENNGESGSTNATGNTDTTQNDPNDNATDHNESVDTQVANANDGTTPADANNQRLDESKGLTPNLDNASKNQTYSGLEPDKSAAQLGVESKEPADFMQRLAEQHAADGQTGNNMIADEDAEVTYSCHPMSRFAIGPFQFENSVLKLKGKGVGEFEKLLDTMPLSERSRIFKLDHDKVDLIVKSRQAATQLDDSSVERRALDQLKQQGAGQTFGTEEVGSRGE